MKAKKVIEKELTNQIKNFTIEETESYLELLLIKCLEAVEDDDLLIYGSIEKILNDSLTIFTSKFRFFNILYNSIKLRVANKFLKKYFKNNSVSVLENVNINDSFLTFEKAEEIIKAENYMNYLEAKNNVLNNYNPNTIYSNDKYCYLHNEGKLIDKEKGFNVFIDVFENLELLNAFITKDSPSLTEAEKKISKY